MDPSLYLDGVGLLVRPDDHARCCLQVDGQGADLLRVLVAILVGQSRGNLDNIILFTKFEALNRQDNLTVSYQVAVRDGLHLVYVERVHPLVKDVVQGVQELHDLNMTTKRVTAFTPSALTKIDLAPPGPSICW